MQIKNVALDFSTAGDKVIFDASAGQIVRVLGYVLVAKGATDATWKSATTVIGGTMGLAAGGGVVAPVVPKKEYPWMQTAPGEDLILTLTGSVVVGGHAILEVQG